MKDLQVSENLLPIENFDLSKYVIEDDAEKTVLMIPGNLLPEWTPENIEWIRKQYKEVTITMQRDWGNIRQVTIFKKITPPFGIEGKS
jgi:hypothetical protein